MNYDVQKYFMGKANILKMDDDIVILEHCGSAPWPIVFVVPQPKRPSSGYQLFSRQQRALFPKITMKELGALWKALPASEQGPFMEQAKQLRDEYNQSMETWKREWKLGYETAKTESAGWPPIQPAPPDVFRDGTRVKLKSGLSDTFILRQLRYPAIGH